MASQVVPRAHPHCVLLAESAGVVVGVLASTSLLSILVGASYSSDVRGWWPLLIFLSWVLDACYALAIVVVSYRQRFRLPWLLGHTLILAALRVCSSLLYHLRSPAERDWTTSGSAFLWTHGAFVVAWAVGVRVCAPAKQGAPAGEMREEHL